MKVSGEGMEGDLGARAALIGARLHVGGVGADLLERRHGVAMLEAHLVDLAVAAADLELEPGRQGVDHRNADAVQTAGDLVGILVEFPAGMELGHDDLGRRDAFFLVDVGRDAAAVVDHGRRAVGIEDDGHEVGMAGQRLVDGVVDDLVDHVVQARAVIGVADIHAGAFADRVQPLEDLDRVGAVFAVAGGLFFAHEAFESDGFRQLEF